MKRSQMLDVLRTAMIETGEISNMVHPDSVDHVLKTVEKAGMTPPFCDTWPPGNPLSNDSWRCWDPEEEENS